MWSGGKDNQQHLRIIILVVLIAVLGVALYYLFFSSKAAKMPSDDFITRHRPARGGRP